MTASGQNAQGGQQVVIRTELITPEPSEAVANLLGTDIPASVARAISAARAERIDVQAIRAAKPIEDVIASSGVEPQAWCPCSAPAPPPNETSPESRPTADTRSTRSRGNTSRHPWLRSSHRATWHTGEASMLLPCAHARSASRLSGTPDRVDDPSRSPPRQGHQRHRAQPGRRLPRTRHPHRHHRRIARVRPESSCDPDSQSG